MQAGAAQPAAGFKGACYQQLPKMLSLEQFACTHNHTPHNALLAALTQGCGRSRRPMSLSHPCHIPPHGKRGRTQNLAYHTPKLANTVGRRSGLHPKNNLPAALLHRLPQRWGLVPQDGPTPGSGSALSRVGACPACGCLLPTCSLLPELYIHLSKTAARCALLPAGVHSQTPAHMGALHHVRTIGCSHRCMQLAGVQLLAAHT